MPFSRGSSQPRDRTRSPALQADSLLSELQGSPQNQQQNHLGQTDVVQVSWDPDVPRGAQLR